MLVLAVLLSIFLVLALLGVISAGLLGVSWARKLLIPAAAGLWLIGVGLAAALLSWWLAVLLVIVGLGADASAGACRATAQPPARGDGARSGAATAAWSELMAESIDRGAPVPAAETIRAAARRLAREHNLDDAGKNGLRLVIGAIERSWYSAEPDRRPGAARCAGRGATVVATERTAVVAGEAVPEVGAASRRPRRWPRRPTGSRSGV